MEKKEKKELLIKTKIELRAFEIFFLSRGLIVKKLSSLQKDSSMKKQ